jgi:hypothetical protein
LRGQAAALDAADEPGFLGQRNELAGWQPVTGGEVPSDHGFDANHLLITKPDQGLILDREFALGQGLRDPGGYREPADVRALPFGVEHRVTVGASPATLHGRRMPMEWCAGRRPPNFWRERSRRSSAQRRITGWR